MHADDLDLTEIWGQIYVNGKLAAAGGAAISALDRGLLYGDGVFETIRVYSGRPFMLDAHLERMAEGCSVISLPMPDPKEIKRGAERVLEANGLSDAYLRITVTRGATGSLWHDLAQASPTIIIMTKPFSPQEFGEGLRLAVSTFRSDEQSPLSRIKQAGILWKILARAEAKRAGMDDAVLLNTNGHIAEATSANILWMRSGTLYTPSLNCGILSGITRRIVIEIAREQGIAVVEGEFALGELGAADEAFLTSSTLEVAPIRSLNDKEFADAAPGPATRQFMELYHSRTLCITSH